MTYRALHGDEPLVQSDLYL